MEEEYKAQVFAEREEMDKKLTALIEFIERNPEFCKLPPDEKRLLRSQRSITLKYCDLLDALIEHFTGEV